MAWCLCVTRNGRCPFLDFLYMKKVVIVNAGKCKPHLWGACLMTGYARGCYRANSPVRSHAIDRKPIPYGWEQ